LRRPQCSSLRSGLNTVADQSSQHANARMHKEIRAFRCADQAGNRSLPLGGILVGLGQLHDAVGGVP
jgi:hypothetical protein